MSDNQKFTQSLQAEATTQSFLTKHTFKNDGHQRHFLHWSGGVLLTLGIALVATWLVQWPLFSFMGPMILSILIGMCLRHLLPLTARLQTGFSFSSKTILRTGIILLGLRLNLYQIATAGLPVLFINIIVILFTIAFMWWIGKRLNIDPTMRSLLAAGTAICGAAAIVAVAPVLRAKPEKVAVAVAYIAITGTLFATAYSIFYGFWQPDPALYGAFVGSTLHEVAHVVAAGAAGGTNSADMAILVKLGRVLLLIPVVLLFLWFTIKKQPVQNSAEKQVAFSKQGLPVPWFIFGFLGMSAFHTLFSLPDSWVKMGIETSTLFLAMGMSGLGLGVHFSSLKEGGIKTAIFTILGSIGILIVGLVAVFIGLGYI